MSSIQQAIGDDIRGCRGGKFNPVALNSKQEQQNGPLVDDYTRRMAQQREEVRIQRAAEGGKAGGYNERQDQADRRAPADDEGEFDDFGRRKIKHPDREEASLSKAERARMALQRLQQKAKRRGNGLRDQSRSPRGSRHRSQSPSGRHRR
mmetsp:Transcript_108889/g.318642  ORF Transcript_108889/g.318642 Transcript_108889/m.318642 type:complete len:150 (+) Transcript_108889:148-597(+)